ncbi:hypothetical protein K0M31_001218 [Melipona bicolor]|uniref:Uncharacterized protein n=1 Tax=Melipona bicolor TaxID=60889 RepID=A0AA40GF25_9HYME|nr:hypothetical protein K0M31_001218 [Melipona bicolor]
MCFLSITGGDEYSNKYELEEADVFESERDSLIGNRESNSASKFPKSPIPLSPEDISILESGILTISGNEIRAEASDQTDLWLAERAFRGVLQEGFGWKYRNTIFHPTNI